MNSVRYCWDTCHHQQQLTLSVFALWERRRHAELSSLRAISYTIKSKFVLCAKVIKSSHGFEKTAFNFLYSDIFYFSIISQSILLSLDLEMLIKEQLSQRMKFDLCFTFLFSELLHPCFFSFTFLPLETDFNLPPSPPAPTWNLLSSSKYLFGCCLYSKGVCACIFLHTGMRGSVLAILFRAWVFEHQF